MRRCVIFAHFDRKNQIADYVLFYLRELKKNCHHLVFVSTSQLPKFEIKKLKGLTDHIILRENLGYDFYSWKMGLSSVPDLKSYDELIICNDSVFGPLKPLGPILNQMSSAPCDFWGFTNSVDVKEHLQTYFVVFKKNVVTSKAFKNFWDSVQPLFSKHEVVKQYEIKLTDFLAQNGFKYSVVTGYKRRWALPHLPAIVLRKLKELKFKSSKAVSPKDQISQNSKKIWHWSLKFFNLSINPTQYAWKEVIKNGTPFIKVELLRDNPALVPLKGWEQIVKSENYFPVESIHKHLTHEIC